MMSALIRISLTGLLLWRAWVHSHWSVALILTLLILRTEAEELE